MKSKFKVPHSYVIIIMLLIAVSLLTYVIPAGEYDRFETETGLTMVDSESYTEVESTPVPIWKIPNFIMAGLESRAGVIFPLLIIGGALEVVLSTGVFHAYAGRMAHKSAGREKMFIPAILLVFALIGLTQSTNKFIGFAPLGVMLAATLGYDAIVGVAIILLGVGIGFSSGVLAPTTAIAQEMAELTAYSGMSMRVLAFIGLYLVTAIYIVRYAERTKKDPTASYIYGVEGIQEFDAAENEVEVEGKHPLILLLIVASFGVLMYGAIKFGWGLVETAVCFIWMALVIGFAYGYGPSKIAQLIVKGARGMTSAALIVGLGAAVALILSEAKVLDTVVYSLANMLALFPNFIKAPMMLVMNVIVNGFITSGTGQAAVVMPVMIPLADVSGITRQTTVLAYKMGDGICNYILPHASALMGFLGATGVPYDRWMKFMGKLFGLWMLVGSAVLMIAQAIGYS